MADELKELVVFRGQAVLNNSLAWTWMYGVSARAYEIRQNDEGMTREEAIESAKKYASKNRFNRVLVLTQGGSLDQIIDI